MKIEEGYSEDNPMKSESFAAKKLELQQNTDFKNRL